MMKKRLIQRLSVVSAVLWGCSVFAQDVAATNSLLQDAQKASGAAAPGAVRLTLGSPVQNTPSSPPRDQ